MNAEGRGSAPTVAAAADHNLEIELKLGGEPAALDQAWRAVVMAGAQKPNRTLRSTYFDTFDHRVRKSGYTLRVREDGKRFVQTLKSEAASGSTGSFERSEWSKPVDGLVPALPAASDPAVARTIGVLESANLKPAFLTDVARRTVIVEISGLDKPKAVIELARDSGEIRADGARDPISEIELELVEGPPSALYDLAIMLQSKAPLWIQTASKAKRGYVLAAGETYPGIKAPPTSLERTITVDEALGRIFKGCARHCLANHDAVLDGSDPEGVHQMRVALRRMRSALVIFKSVLPPADAAWLEEDAKRLINVLGPARDWDVFAIETLAAVKTARAGDANLDALGAAAEAERRRAYDQSEAMLRSPEYAAFVLKLGRWLETTGWKNGGNQALLDQPLLTLANEMLDKRHKRVLKLGRGFEKLPDKDLHRVRIALKKLRYTTEFFVSLFPTKKARPYIKTLRRLQDDLGHLNDVAVAEDLLGRLVQDRKGRNAPAIRYGAGQIIGWYAHALEETRPRIAGDWHAFVETPRFWRAAKKRQK